MKETKRYRIISMLALMLAATLIFSGSSAAFEEGGLVLLNSHAFTWTDPESGGSVIITENVYEGCEVDGSFNPHDMTWEYVVDNINYDPIPGLTNGFSGFQVIFPGPVDELYNQLSPAIGGPWEQNAYSGVVSGAEWDAPLPGVGIMPGETGVFSFCANEREDVVTEDNWAHTWGLGIPEPIVDADGTLSPLSGVPGAVEVAIGSALTSWPTGFDDEGIDWFDNDDSCTWTSGDDLHVEGIAYPTALRDALHDDNPDYIDPVVLDIDGSFFDGQQVDVDLESGSAFTGCPGVDPLLKFHDANGITNWDDGEDIVLDLNGDNIFGEIINTQTFIFYGPMSVPGDLLYELDIACSEDNKICKKVKYMDEDRDGYIEVGEVVEFLQVIQVHNPTCQVWSDVKVSDRFGAEIEVVKQDATQGTVVLTTKGNSEKVFIKWDVGDLGPGETANLVLRTKTDITPGGDQSYTECSYHEYNSGAVLKFLVEGRQESYDTGEIIVSVLTPGLAGDCDGDGFTDAEELGQGTDPHVFDERILLYYGNNGPANLGLLKSHYEGSGYLVDYTDAWPSTLIFPSGFYTFVYINGPGLFGDDPGNYFTAAQKTDLQNYMAVNGRVAVAGDHSGIFGINTVNDLLGTLSGNIVQNADAVTPDGDLCNPLTDITHDPVTDGLISVDPSATSSLEVIFPAISLVRVDPAPYTCDTGVINGATLIARDGRLVVMGDINILDDFGFNDPQGDGDNAAFADNLVKY